MWARANARFSIGLEFLADKAGDMGSPGRMDPLMCSHMTCMGHMGCIGQLRVQMHGRRRMRPPGMFFLYLNFITSSCVFKWANANEGFGPLLAKAKQRFVSESSD